MHNLQYRLSERITPEWITPVPEWCLMPSLKQRANNLSEKHIIYSKGKEFEQFGLFNYCLNYTSYL